MVSENQIESNHRKHRRSSSPSNEVAKPSKRHKHHSSKHSHRHHRDKKHDEESQYGDNEFDMEEGEISGEEEDMSKLDSGRSHDNNLPVHVDYLQGGSTHESRKDESYFSEKIDIRGSPSSKKSEKNKSRARSPSNTRHTDEVAVRGRHRGSSRDYCRDTLDLGRNEERYYQRGYSKEDERRSSREVLERERSTERETDRERRGSKDRDRGRDLRRESQEIEAERGSRKRGSIDGDRRGERDRDNDRGRSRDRGRYNSRERGRENERERRTERDKDNGREIQSDREKHKSLDDGYGEARHKQSGHSRHEAEDDSERRSSNSIKGHNSKDGSSKAAERSRNDNDDNSEVVVWDLADQEEEELKRIEESKKRMQAILEKHKKKSEEQNISSSHDKGKAGIPKQSSTVADVLGSGTLGPIASAVNEAKAGFENTAIDGDVTKLSSIVGETSARLVISDSDRTLASAGLGEGSPKGERSDDMFSDDMFGESPAGRKMGYLRGKGNGLPMVRSGLHDNWDDAEGYYSYQFGELLDGRYEIMATHGKGVFSTVVRAKDTKAELDEPEEVAIKIIRSNETMHKAGQTEVQILKKLAGSDPENKRHCVRFLSSFKYRNHLCLVFESLHLNLREVVKKFGRNIGLKLSAVRVYAMQLFISLKHLKNCGVLHCDIKPDNMLVNSDNNVLKLCDFGSAMFAGQNEVTPYLVSRFYRAPEIILGLPYDHPLDIWSVGCCLYELYSGKVLFPGSTNNDMLRLHMELKGPFPKKMLRKGAFIDQHFDQDLNFYATEEDSATGKTIKRMMANIQPKDLGSVIKGYSGEHPKVLAHFRDLMEKLFILDPQKRLTVSQALAHPFITGK